MDREGSKVAAFESRDGLVPEGAVDEMDWILPDEDMGDSEVEADAELGEDLSDETPAAAANWGSPLLKSRWQR